MNSQEYKRMYDAEESHWWYVGLHELVLEYVRRESVQRGRPLDIFDAGCGTGRLCHLMSAYGDVQGADFHEDAIAFSRERGVNVTRGDLNDLALEPECFDVITSIDVLYHAGIRDDVAVLRKLQCSLRPGGLLIINLVAHEFLRSTHDIAVHTRERYTRETLCERLRSAGFHIPFVSYRVSFIFPLIAAYRIAARILMSPPEGGAEISSDVSLPHPVVNALLLKILQLENRLAWSGIALPLGSSVFAIARKSASTVNP